jgi:hypothetical protein
MTRAVVRRNLVVQRWGTPQATVGSLNEPREQEEHGLRFNEKWLYRAPRNDPAKVRERVVYWLRYDFVASYVLDRDGQWAREDPRALLVGLSDREFVPENSH